MEFITIKEACKITNAGDRTIRDWIDEGKLEKFHNDKNILCVNKRQLLKLLPTVLTLFNFKGGCGKTSSSILLTDYFEKQGHKILLVDLDQQGNLSQSFFTYDDIKESLNLYDYFENKTPLFKIVKKYNDNIDLLPSSIKLSRKNNIDTMELTSLKKDFVSLFKKYSLVIIDCPPSFVSFSKFGMLLANYILCPVLAEPYSYDGLAEVLSSIKMIAPYNTDYKDYRAFISSHKAQKSIIRMDYKLAYKEQLKSKMLDGVIPEFVGVVERSMAMKNIFDMYPAKNKQLQMLNALFDEVDLMIYGEK